MADKVARNPARVAGMVSVAMHDAAVAAEELKRCVLIEEGVRRRYAQQLPDVQGHGREGRYDLPL
jgi:hypothetical protein